MIRWRRAIDVRYPSFLALIIRGKLRRTYRDAGRVWQQLDMELLHAFDQHPDIINNDGAAAAINVRDPYSCGRRAERGTQ